VAFTADTLFWSCVLGPPPIQKAEMCTAGEVAWVKARPEARTALGGICRGAFRCGGACHPTQELLGRKAVFVAGFAIDWILKMECEVNTQYDGVWNYPAPGDTWDKNCAGYPDKACSYAPNQDGRVNLSYYPPGYFRAFGDFLASTLDASKSSASEREGHRAFWYKTAATVYPVKLLYAVE